MGSAVSLTTMTDSLHSHNSNPRNRVKGFASRGPMFGVATDQCDRVVSQSALGGLQDRRRHRAGPLPFRYCLRKPLLNAQVCISLDDLLNVSTGFSPFPHSFARCLTR